MNDECNERTCPWQGGYSLSGRLRKLIHNPDRILSDYIRSDMWVVDAGCGMGFMAVPAASAVGENGKVIMVDIQPEMLSVATQRLEKAGLAQRAIAIQCRQRSLCIDEYYGKVDFAYAFMMVHEVEDKAFLLQELYESLKEGGTLLIAEPYIHVSKEDFQDTVECAKKIGFENGPPERKISFCHSALCRKTL